MLLHVSLLAYLRPSCLPASLVYWFLGLLCGSLFSLVPAMSWLLSFWKTQGEAKIIPEPSHDSCNYEWTTALPNTSVSHIEIQHPTIAIVFPKHLRNWLDSIIIEWKLLQGLSLSAGLRSHCRVYRLQSIHTKQWISPRQGVQWSLTGPVCQKNLSCMHHQLATPWNLCFIVYMTWKPVVSIVSNINIEVKWLYTWYIVTILLYYHYIISLHLHF